MWLGGLIVVSQVASDPNKRGKTVYRLFNRPLCLQLHDQNRTRLKSSGYKLLLSTLLECLSSFVPAKTRKVTNLLYSPSTPGDYLSHDLVTIHKDNSYLKFVRSHRRSVQYLTCRGLLSVASFMIAPLRFVNRNFHTKP